MFLAVPLLAAWLTTGCGIVVPGTRTEVSTFIAALDGLDRDVRANIAYTLAMEMTFPPDEQAGRMVIDRWSPVDRFVHVRVPERMWKSGIVKDERGIAAVVDTFQGAALVILWGKALAFEGDTVILWQLSVPRLDKGHPAAVQDWTVRVGREPGALEFTVDLPARFMAMPPVVLKRALIEELRATERLEMFADRERTRPTGFLVVGTAFGVVDSSFLDSAPDMLEIKLLGKNVQGWVRVPKLVTQRQGALELASGVIYAIGGSSNWAKRFFAKALEAEGTSTANKHFAYLFRGMAEEKAGRSARADFAEAQRLNPASEVPAKYVVMSYLAEIERLQSQEPPDPRAKDVFRELEAHVTQARALLAQDAEWTTELTAKLRDLQRRLFDEQASRAFLEGHRQVDVVGIDAVGSTP